VARNPSPVPAGRARAARRAGVLLAALVAVAPLASGCSLLGPRGGVGSPTNLTVSSPVFSFDVPLPKLYTCRGGGLSPPLQWSGAPAGTKSFALVVDDSDAPITPYIYWLVYDIGPATLGIAQNVPPRHAVQGPNSQGQPRYDPPCPPVHGTHMYRFTVYALNVSKLPLHSGAGLRATWSAIAMHVIGLGRLTGTAGSIAAVRSGGPVGSGGAAGSSFPAASGSLAGIKTGR
jgi:Raf kinase inhibitor-like YbhB/YbcL family protein